MIELLLAAALQLPQATEKTSKHLLRRSTIETKEQTAAARVALWIDPKGKVRGCDLVDFEGNERSAKQLCRGMVGARLAAARDSDGAPAYSFYVTDLTAYPSDDRWRAEQMKANLKGPTGLADITISLEQMPNAFFWKSTQSLALLIDQDGQMTHCQSDGDHNQSWVQVACEKAELIEFEPKLSREGVPTPYVRNLTVSYES